MSDDQVKTQSGMTILKGKIREFSVQTEIAEKYPVLMQLILHTESMTDDEREYWYQILPVMNDEQIDRLFKILDNEKKQLEKLDEKYNKQMKKINDTENIAIKEEEIEKRRQERIEEEQASEEQEKSKEEELLASLDEID